MRFLEKTFGEKCVRCGKRLGTREFDGLPTCPGCHRDLALAADDDDDLPCPLDGELMDKVVVENVVIDKCPQCGGVWLDPGELQLIKEAFGDRQDQHAAFFPIFFGTT